MSSLNLVWIEKPSVPPSCVDGLDKIEAFLPTLDEMILEGLVTLEKVR